MDFTPLRAKYLERQLAGDRRGALRLLQEEGLGRGASVAELQFSVIAEAQREIGRLWQENRISIAQEHLATAISQLALAQLFQLAAAAPRSGRKVMVACVEGELHDLPARLLADHLDLEGFEVHFVGANVPTDALLDLVALERPEVLALSVTMSFHAGALRSAVRRLKERFPQLPLMVGGHACQWSPGLLDELAASGARCAADARDAVALLTALLPSRPAQGEGPEAAP